VSKHDINECRLLVNAKYHCTNDMVYTKIYIWAHYFICIHKWIIFSFLSDL